MKKSRKLLCVLLALVMVVSLLPVMAFAADEDVAEVEDRCYRRRSLPETEGVVGDVIKNLFNNLPNYRCHRQDPSWARRREGRSGRDL